MLHQNSAAAIAKLHLRRGDIAFDIGANSGDVTRALADIARHVYAFEPNVEVIAGLKGERRRNVTIIEKAVSDTPGEATFYVDRRDGVGAVASSLMRLSGMEGQTIERKVPVTTIDEFCRATGVRPDLIKIDVEGLEPKVISGAREIIDAGTPIIIFELWESRWQLYQEMISFLTERYHLVKTSDGSPALPYYETPRSDIDDILCLPRVRTAMRRGLFSRLLGI